MVAKAVTVNCPECGRFLFEASDFGRAVCRDCGGEVVYRSRRRRDEEKPAAERYPPAGFLTGTEHAR